MKRYNHINTIKLRKKIINYYNRVEGFIVSSVDIIWHNSSYNEKKIRGCVINNKFYTQEEFNNTFIEYISRFDELNEQTKKFNNGVDEHVRSSYSKPFINEIITPNQNSRIYPPDIIKNNFKIKSTYFPLFTPKPMSFDLVAGPGFGESILSK